MARNKRTWSEAERTKRWFELVNFYLVLAGEIDRGLAGRALGRRLIDIADKTNKRKKIINKGHLGTQEAWRWWQEGRSTPSQETRDAVDHILSSVGQPPIGFVVCGPGEVDLTPVWLWDPYSSKKMDIETIDKVVTLESKFWRRVKTEDLLTVALWANIVFPHDVIDLHAKKTTWPARLLLPTSAAVALPKHENAPFPHLFFSNSISKVFSEQDIEDQENYSYPKSFYTEKEKIDIFKEWQEKFGSSAPGDSWHDALQRLPATPYFERSCESDWAVEIVKNELEKIAEEARIELLVMTTEN